MVIGIDSRAISQEKYSGVEEYAFNLLDALFSIDRKNQYILFAAGKNLSKRYTTFSFKAQKTNPNVKVRHLKTSNRLLNACFKFLGQPKIDKLMIGNPGLNSNQSIGEFKEESGKRVDIVFSPNINLLPVSGACKKIITFHDLSFVRYDTFFSFKQRFWHNFINPAALAKEADFIIAVSQSTKRDLVEIYNVSEEKIKMIYSGIKPVCGIQSPVSSIEKIRVKYNLPDNYILYLGTIEPRKNITGLIKAFELFNTKYRMLNIRYKLVVAGTKGWLYGDIFRAAKNSAFKNEIIFTGNIAEEDKPYLYRAARMFVYPSFYEGFGFPPLEAMSAGIPVVASDCSSLTEAVSDAALIVNPYNISQVAWAINEVLSYDNLQDKMIKKGYEQVKKFSWEKCARETLEVFEAVNKK